MIEFGRVECCGGEDAEAALEYCFSRLTSEHRVVEDSHFGVSVRVCPSCGQRFVVIFTEFVDWSGGDDAQYFDIVPVTEDEAAAVVAGNGADLAALGALGAGRRRLSSGWPTGGVKTISWRTGAFNVTEGH
ncbi:hypothetical protein [Yinghuangia seranimata]|uniref:hypothetical protein n=1 Tax=Yinghuangia seranimata TaxID=408067 RepID=UPI00248CC2E1|nr:hypothetical protein [Yinghuangia seranimata]MDI2129570.1 hypothetical protein [Yinghuangia seranimata]